MKIYNTEKIPFYHRLGAAVSGKYMINIQIKIDKILPIRSNVARIMTSITIKCFKDSFKGDV